MESSHLILFFNLLHLLLDEVIITLIFFQELRIFRCNIRPAERHEVVDVLAQTQAAGRPFTFSFWVGGRSIPSTGGVCRAQVTFYERDGFRGQTFTVDNVVPNFAPLGFNDKARSAIVEHGRWEVCEDIHFRGNCVVLVPGSYDFHVAYTLVGLAAGLLVARISAAFCSDSTGTPLISETRSGG